MGEREVTRADVRGWEAGLDALQARLAPRFARSEQRARVRRYLAGLLGPVERKNGWQLAEHAGEGRPYGMQRLLAAAKWDADAVRDDLVAYVLEHLGDARAVLVLDETGFLKQGTKSVGVKRQYSGAAGRVANCQVGVFVTYASARGHVLLDRELYLPAEWAADAARRREAGVPAAVGFATKPELARRMLARLRAAGVKAAWVTGDTVYGGGGALRSWLEAERQPYVLAIAANDGVDLPEGAGVVRVRADEVARYALDPHEWHRLSAGDGAKGPRVYDWALVPLAAPAADGFERARLLRRPSDAPDDPQQVAYYATFAPAGTSLPTLVAVAGRRWTVEESLERAKGEVGLAHYEVRRWDGWYRHITLALFALAYLAVLRADAPGAKGGPST